MKLLVCLAAFTASVIFFFTSLDYGSRRRIIFAFVCYCVSIFAVVLVGIYG